MTDAWNIRNHAIPVWHLELARAVDSLSVASREITELALMENAARAVFEAIKNIATISLKSIVVLAGKGNNGGDAIAVARFLAEVGLKPTVLVPADFHGDCSTGCKEQLKLAKKFGVEPVLWRKGMLTSFMSQPTLLVDGLLGLGFKGSLKDGDVKAMLTEAAALQEKTVVAVDIPSGMNPDHGSNNPILKADVTVTFGALKPAHAIAPSRDYCGTVHCADIGFSPSSVAKAVAINPIKFAIIDDSSLLAIDPWSRLSNSAHKFDRGHVLVIGGSAGKMGAPFLSGLAALRAGAGWVTLALPNVDDFGVKYEAPPELTYENLWDGDQIDGAKTADFIAKRKVKVIVIGPGTMTQPVTVENSEFLAEFSRSGGAVVFDAAATQGLIPILKNHSWNPERVLCLPHPGEWLKLIALNDEGEKQLPAPVSAESLVAIRKVIGDVPATLIHKGATPIILSESKQQNPAYICTGGSNILARAGTGDILAGVSAAHLAQGIPADFSFARSYAVVVRSSRIAANRFGKDAVLASDIVSTLGLKE